MVVAKKIEKGKKKNKGVGKEVGRKGMV